MKLYETVRKSSKLQAGIWFVHVNECSFRIQIFTQHRASAWMMSQQYTRHLLHRPPTSTQLKFTHKYPVRSRTLFSVFLLQIFTYTKYSSTGGTVCSWMHVPIIYVISPPRENLLKRLYYSEPFRSFVYWDYIMRRIQFYYKCWTIDIIYSGKSSEQVILKKGF